MQKSTGLSIELNFTMRPNQLFTLSISSAYAVKERIYDERIESQDVVTTKARVLAVVPHTASTFTESFRANYSEEKIKTFDRSYSTLYGPILITNYDGTVVSVLTDFGDGMSDQSYELVHAQRLQWLEEGRAKLADIRRRSNANEFLTEEEQECIDRMNENYENMSDMWKRYNSGGDVTPEEMVIILRVTEGGEKGGATNKAAWDTAADARDDDQKRIVKAQQEGGEKGGATNKAAWDTAADARDDDQKRIVAARDTAAETNKLSTQFIMN